MIRLDGRKVLVTGGSRGIGRATALLFAQAGADVALNYVSNQRAAEEVLMSVEKLGRRCLVYKTEIASRADVDRMVGDVLAKWGELDTLVNNAGVWTYLEMGRMDEAVYHETIGINVDGVFYAINAVVPAMKEHGRGSIINVTSTAGVRGEAFHSHYAASKGGVVSMMQALAVELARHKIRANAIQPGWIDTPMTDKTLHWDKFSDKVLPRVPLRRWGAPEDFGGVAVYLASDASAYHTGDTLLIDGGYTKF